jgi:hypothetical protein
MAAAQRDDFTNEVARRLRGSGRKGLAGSNGLDSFSVPAAAN